MARTSIRRRDSRRISRPGIQGMHHLTTKIRDAGKTYDVLILCSVGERGRPAGQQPTYPQIAEIMRSFKILRTPSL